MWFKLLSVYVGKVEGEVHLTWTMIKNSFEFSSSYVYLIMYLWLNDSITQVWCTCLLWYYISLRVKSTELLRDIWTQNKFSIIFIIRMLANSCKESWNIHLQLRKLIHYTLKCALCISAMFFLIKKTPVHSIKYYVFKEALMLYCCTTDYRHVALETALRTLQVSIMIVSNFKELLE